MSEVSEYQAKVRLLMSARRKVRALVKTTTEVSKYLEGWSKTDPATVNGVIDIAASRWPTRERLIEVVAMWKQTSKDVMQAWDKLTADNRLCVVSPENILFEESDKAEDS